MRNAFDMLTEALDSLKDSAKTLREASKIFIEACRDQSTMTEEVKAINEKARKILDDIESPKISQPVDKILN